MHIMDIQGKAKRRAGEACGGGHTRPRRGGVRVYIKRSSSYKRVGGWNVFLLKALWGLTKVIHMV